MSENAIRTLLLPNKEHPYGNSLQDSLAKCGVIPLKCDAGWGFEFHKNLDVIHDLNPDILHLQWPESLCMAQESDDLKALLDDTGAAFSELRKMGTPIVWTMHNLRPHIIFKSEFQTALYELYASNANGVIHHSRCGMDQVLQTYIFSDNTKHAIVRHGYFTAGTESDVSQEAARVRLDLPADSMIYLFCGAFRKDKNIDILVQAMGDRGPKAPYMLVMVGQEQAVAASLYPGHNFDYPNVLWPGRLSFEDLTMYVKAVDSLVFAHGDKHLTSAGPHLSQTYLKPQVCLFSEYNKEVLGDSAFYFQKGDDITGNLRNCLAGITAEMLKNSAKPLEKQREEYHWHSIGAKTKSFYEDLLYGK
ncbi:MAG: glycosyltransferase [Spirochaetales bacterium]|jgi:beta-1,4-mannosyltransferase|nr:glycosyltransferase [Spirochaetales bacterium]